MDMLTNNLNSDLAAEEAVEGVQIRTLQDLELALIGGGGGDVIFA